ncbi:MAG: hypothetical protein KDF64_17760 [Geminicoccaceae bacterium]|nr:hypothetical protein [Geminicoccaceae bacterium]
MLPRFIRPLLTCAVVAASTVPMAPAEALTSIAVRLKAEAGSDFSRYRLRVNGKVVADRVVKESHWTDENFVVETLDADKQNRVSIEHYFDTPSRALYVDRITVDGTAVSASSGVQDVGPQDGRFLRRGAKAGHFPWNGILTVSLPSEAFGSGHPDESGGVAAGNPSGSVQTVASGGSTYFRPPMPLSKLRIYNIKPSGIQRVTGGANEDLLLVSPNGEINGKFQIDVRGFRGVYWIGASFNPRPLGHLITPRGKKVDGVGSLVRIQTHANAAGRPFIYLDRMRLKTDHITFGDFLQLGGAARHGDWGDWPDVYRCRIKADPLFGWSSYHGGSFSRHVSHSDFTKFERGGVRHSYAARIDVKWGYQTEFVLPSWASGKSAYNGPDGKGTAQYWDYAARAVTNPAIGSVSRPKNFFLARGDSEILAGKHITYTFNTNGKGVYSVPVGGRGSAIPTVNPGGGKFAPRESGAHLTWPAGSRHPLVKGRLVNGAKTGVPTMVNEGETGFRHRVTNRSQLINAIRSGCR